MLGYLAHQFTLVDCGELTATLLMPALKLVHFLLSSINIGAQVASITTTCYNLSFGRHPRPVQLPVAFTRFEPLLLVRPFRQ